MNRSYSRGKNERAQNVKCDEALLQSIERIAVRARRVVAQDLNTIWLRLLCARERKKTASE